MKIIDISLKKVSLSLKEPFTTALRSVDSIDEVIIVLSTPTLKGYGSAPATLAVTGDTLETIYDDLDKNVNPAFLEYDLCDYEKTFTKLSQLAISKSAQTAMDIALHDLFSRQAKLPLFEYLQGKQRALKTLYTISVNTPSKMLSQALTAFESGFEKLKVKLDAKPELNIQRIRLLHEKLPKAELFLDINQAFTVEQTLNFMQTIKDIPITLLEQPLPASNLEGMKLLTASNQVPILADESVFSLADAKQLIKEKASHYINVKLRKCGGIYEARKILDLCQKHDLQCMMGSMLEGGISVTAALHLALAYDNVIFADLDGPTLAKETLIRGGIIYDAMNISLSSGDGLGVAL